MKGKALWGLRFSAAASAVGVAIYIAPSFLEHEGRRELAWLFLLLAAVEVPYLYVLFRTRNGSDLRGVTVARYWAATIGSPMVFVLPIWLLVALADGDSLLTMAPVASFATLQMVLYLSAREVWRSEARPNMTGAEYFPSYLKIFGLTTVLFISSLYASGEYDEKSNEAAALDTIRLVIKCSNDHAVRYPQRGYPQTLEQLGPSGEKCIGGKLARGSSRFYEFSYLAGSEDSSGRRARFEIKARPSSSHSGITRFFADQSGTIHWTQEERDATASDPTLP